MTTAEVDIYLASRSPRRHELLGQIGVRYAAIETNVDETMQSDESAEIFVVRLALEKARAGRRQLGGVMSAPVLGADTVVVLDHDVLGKPRDKADAVRMLKRLSGNTHQVYTGVAMVGEFESTRLNVSNVTFRDISDAEIEAYWDSAEPADKAGAYAIQGRAAVFVEELRGSYSGVMGLPLYETAHLLDEFEVNFRRQWRP